MVMDIKSLVPGHTKTNLSRSDKAKKKSASSDASSAAAESDDSVSLTGAASKIGALVAQMKAAPVVDPDRVSPVKEKMDKGEYDIDYERVANKMLDFESSYYGY
ncbi:flagellar biosynthesis anti-sigma factor FlgM [Aliikangiella marina]|uniref:Negative regulator of flagellin synthesis n=2 Tax=Aliikangiella marina TaxID=1712262 RepID=A0A545TDJ8_9GAMM|nr:flagellar biosynthesis anti-sigma factor FlgM [Aliikangiella marina]